MSSRNAELVLRLVDQVTAPSRAIRSTLGMLDRSLNGLASSWRNQAGAMLGLSAPIAIGGRQLVGDVLTYEKALTDLTAVMTATDAQLAAIKTQSDDFTDIGVGQAAYLAGATEFAKAGFGADVLPEVTPAGLGLAKAGDVSTEMAAGVITSTLASYGVMNDHAAWATRVADQTAFAADKSLASVEDLALSMTYLAPVAGALGIELETLTASQIALANSGILGERAGTGLRAVMLSLVDPTERGLDAFERMGLSIDDFVKRGQRVEALPLLDQLADAGFDGRGMGIETALQSHLDNADLRADPARQQEIVSALILAAISEPMDDAAVREFEAVLGDQMAILASDVDLVGLFDQFGQIPGVEQFFGAIFGREATASAIALSRANLRDGVDEVLDDSAGYAEEVARKRTAGITGLLARLEASVERFAIILSDSGLLADATLGINAAIDGLSRLGEVNPEILRLGGASAFAVAGLAPLGWALSGVAGSVGFLVNPLTLVAGSLAFLAWQNWSGITEFFRSAETAFKGGLSPEIVTGVADAFTSFSTAVDGLGDGVKWGAWGKAAGDALAATANGIPAVVKRLTDLGGRIAPLATTVLPFFQKLGSAARSIASAAGRLAAGVGEGMISFVESFTANLDPQTVKSLVRFGSAVAGLVGSIADGILSSDRLPKFIEGVEGLARVTADGIDTLVGWIERLVAAVEWMSKTDAYTIGKTLVDNLARGMVDAVPGLRQAVESVQSLMFMATGGRVGSNGASGAPVPAHSNQDGLMVPDATRGAADPGAAWSAMDSIPGYAKGGSYSPGLIMTGEKGPELQLASGHGQVFSARETRELLSGRNDRGGDVININVYGGSTDEVVRKVTNVLQTQMQRARVIAMHDGPVTE